MGHLAKSAEVMKLVNNLMKASEVAVTMQEFSKEMTKVSLPFSCNIGWIFFLVLILNCFLGLLFISVTELSDSLYWKICRQERGTGRSNNNLEK